MVLLRPVRAWHPDPNAVRPDSVVCPVYDTLSPEDEARFSHLPFNAARFVPRPHGTGLEAFLRSARENLRAACQEGAFSPDPSPALYVYGIRFRPPTDVAEAIEAPRRREEYLLLGIVGVLDLDRTAPHEVALHERTFSDRVDERVALADATGMNFAPIMMGYNIPDHRLNDRVEDLLGLDRRLLAFDSKVPPLLTANLNGTSHILWRIEEPEAVRSVQRELEDVRLLVLDGHHRFTAALKRHRAGRPTMPLVMLVEGADRALQLLPWQRVLGGDVIAPEQVIRATEEAFPDRRPLESPLTVLNAIDRLHEMTAHRRRGFILSTADAAFELPGPASSDVGADFDFLHAFLEDRLGLDPHRLEFVRSPRRAIESAAASSSGPGGTAFLLPGLTEKGVEERAFHHGKLMAHKSTMFLPKVAEGVIFAPANGSDDTVPP